MTPFANADRFVWTVNHGTRPYDAMSPRDLADWTRLVPSFEAAASWTAAMARIDSQIVLIEGFPAG